MSDPIPQTDLDGNVPCFDDEDTTAHAAFANMKDLGPVEQAGVMYKMPNGQFCPSVPVTQKQRDDFALRAKMPKGASLGGIFHVHPGDDSAGQVFSPHDIQVANQLKVPSYVLFQKDGSVRKYVPGETPTRTMQLPGSREGAKVADGHPVPHPQQSLEKQQALAAALRTTDASQ